MPRMLFFFDYADPLSWTVELVASQAPPGTVLLERFPFNSGDLANSWSDRVSRADAIVGQLSLSWTPREKPLHSQKAFELAFHSAELGCFDSVHAAIFEAHFVAGRDIGRIDELVRIATDEGLDPSEAKAVLDVDRHAEAVQAWRERAAAGGVTCTPTLSVDSSRVESFENIGALRRVLGLETRED